MKVAFGICVCANTLSKREITDFEEEAELAWISKCDLTARDSAVEWKFAFLRQESTYVTRAGHGASTQVRNFNVILFHVTREPNLALTILFRSRIPFLTLRKSILFFLNAPCRIYFTSKSKSCFGDTIFLNFIFIIYNRIFLFNFHANQIFFVSRSQQPGFILNFCFNLSQCKVWLYVWWFYDPTHAVFNFNTIRN